MKANESFISVSPFAIKPRSLHVQDDFDQYYLDYEVKSIAKKVGPGDEDYVIEAKVIEHKRSINEVVNAEVNDVGVEAYIRRMSLSGLDPMAPVEVSDQVIDYTKVPQTTGEMVEMANNALSAYEKLPAEIRNGMSYEEFMASDYATTIKNWLEGQKPSVEVITDKKEGE